MVAQMDRSHRQNFIFGIIAIFCCWCTRLVSSRTCSSSNIRSPGYPDDVYPENLHCTWTKYASLSSYILKFEIDNLDLEQCSRCTCDYVEVFDGSTTASKSLGKYCTGKINLLSTGLALTIVFHTDHSRSATPNKGFKASYSSILRSDVCYRSLSTNTIGTNYASYGNVECSWTLSASFGYIVVLDVTSLSFGTCSDTCGCGLLEVYDGDSESSPKLDSGCVLPQRLFISEGRSLHIRFTASSSSTTHEFEATYKYVADIGVCESSTSLEAITENSKTVKSYDHPSKYIRHVDCTWIITAGNGELVRFTVKELDGVCVSCGFLQIYDGQTESIGRNLGKWRSGTPDIISSGKYMVVKFKTNNFEIARGITAEYRAIAETDVCTKPTGDQGTIESYGYPNSYPANINCFWNMKSPSNYLIRFYTDEIRFSTNCTDQCDYLEVYDGSTTLDIKLGTYKDNKISLVSSSTELSIVFKTFHIGGHGGFRGKYSFIKESEVCKDNLNLQAGSSMSGQTISSRDFPEKYWGNMHCFWQIQADPEYKIRLIVQTIDFEKCDSCWCDYIQIFDGPDKRSTSLKRWCRDPPDLISSGNHLSIEMRTDEKKHYTGFKAKYFAIHKDQVCPDSGLLTEESGTIKSPNYPEHYYGGIKCDWTITVPARKRIRIKSKSLNLEKCTSCNTCDRIEITDNLVSPGGNPSIGRWCKTSFDVISRGNSVKVTFISNVNNVGENFLIEYETVKEDEVCPKEVISDSSGKLTSLGYPDMTYPGNLNCTYHIKTPNDNQVVRLEFVEFRLAACGVFDSCSTCGDVVQAVDHGEDFKLNHFHPWCSSEPPPTHIFSSGEILLVNFYTDTQSQDVGFRAVYHSVDKNLGCLDTGVLTKTSGGFSGPKAPFDSETLCTWLIKAPANHFVKLTFGYSSIPDKDCTFAYVEAYDGDSPASRSFGRFCEHYWQKEIKSTGSSMYVTLWVDGTIASNGIPSFSATYKAIEIVKNRAGKSARFENMHFGLFVFSTLMAMLDLM